MAEDSDLEKTEEASPRKIEKAREEGDVPRSKELATFTTLVAATAGFWLTGANMVEQLKHFLKQGLSFENAALEDFNQYFPELFQQLLALVWAFLPLAVLLVIAAIFSPMLIGGWLFSNKLLVPNFGRLNPIQGLGNLFSKNAFVELLKAIAKTLIVSIVAWMFFRNEFAALFAMTEEPLSSATSHAGALLLSSFTVLVAALAIIVMFDAPYQMYRYSQKLMMTRQELRDEAKETEGNPEIKAKIRAQQREMARRRMMAQIPTAGVVVTNPTHYAVALKYPENSDKAPYVVAKGVDQTAQKIKEIANENGIVIMEAPPLARALYQHTELEQEIPSSLYTAVAQVLAYVFQLRDWRLNGGFEPEQPELLAIPAGLDPLESGSNGI